MTLERPPQTRWPRRVMRGVAGMLGLAIMASLAGAGPATAAPTAAESWSSLGENLQELTVEATAAGIDFGVSVTDLSGTFSGASMSIGSQEPVKAASVIKLPLLAALMAEADRGTLSLDEVVTIEAGSSNIVGGSGTLRDETFPLDITVGELMELMVQVSDNTATNVLIDRAGGFDAVNAYIESLGFEHLWLGRKMIHPATPPLQENWITSGEVTELLRMLHADEILSPASSEHIIELMKGQLVDTKFGAVVPRDVLANKTGELADVSHDSGYILVPGREVALTVTTAFGDPLTRAEVDQYVQRAASIVYDATREPLAAEPTAWPGLAADVQPILDAAAEAGIDIGVAIEDLSGYYDDQQLLLGAQDRFTTASTIKMSLAATVMHQVERGMLSLDDVVTITEDERYGGSGSLKDNPFPQDVSVGTLLDLTVTISDNTATNKLVDVVGGFDVINALTQAVGIAKEDLHFGRKMFGPIVPPDGDIWLTPHGVNQLMVLFYDIAEGEADLPEFMSAESAQFIIELMLSQQVKTKLGATIPAEVLAHKTGENDTVSHDIGMVLLPGQEITLSVFSRGLPGFSGDVQATANPYLQQIGAAVYAYLLETAPVEQPGPVKPTVPAPAEPPTSGPAPVPQPGGQQVAVGAAIPDLGTPRSVVPLLALAVAMLTCGAALASRRRSRGGRVTQ
ncbi:hypothetical protein D9V41_00160 [Aeromicrobium phragmitis]|uniref:Beta-lactamase class A catalytic domain-containing protein n=1 Tax=Aeromicrobium phragmitis TaxID=2478914 RepID=A0A3L8PPK9_9ACTN|nr:serine hydrolase [Aeromicrobium phragmitis]RLV57114.1 hypothetical protein D9V41_00160 [Aeromicrobium phragmitis]